MDNLSSLIIGPTDKNNIFRFGKLKKVGYNVYIESISKILAENLSRIDIIPDDGVPLDFAKSYKKFGGRLVVGYVPKGKDKWKAIEKYFQFCDRIEEVAGGWTVVNTCLSLKSSHMIGFGISSGTIVEIAYSKYHNKYLGKKIGILLDNKLISSKLPEELEYELNINYFNSGEELKKLISKWRQDAK